MTAGKATRAAMLRLGAALLLLAGLASGGCRSADPSLFPPRAGEPTADAIVLNNHWHTALIFRSMDLPLSLRGQLNDLSVRKYVAIGWGDEGFFRADHITPGLIAQALFYSRGSVLLVIGFDTEPEATFAGNVDIYRVPTTPASLSRIANFAAAAFRRKDGKIIDAGPGIDGGQFFTAEGRYAFYHTCNQWTADGLAAGGLPITAAYATTAGNLAFQLRQLPGVRMNGYAVTAATSPNHSVLQLIRGRRP